MARTGQTSPSAPTRVSDQVLTKVSKSGVRYFYTGREHQVDVTSGDYVLVAGTSLFPGDAHRFSSSSTAIVYRDRLNRYGIGGAPWKIGFQHHYDKPKRKRA